MGLLLALPRQAAPNKVLILDVTLGYLPQILKAVPVPLEVFQLLYPKSVSHANTSALAAAETGSKLRMTAGADVLTLKAVRISVLDQCLNVYANT